MPELPRRGLLVGLAALALPGSVYLATQPKQSVNYIAPVADGNMSFGGCVIRFSDVVNGKLVPAFLDDEKHAPIGVTGLGVNDAGNLLIYTDPGSADQVVTCYTNPDETMTRMGVTGGPSGGLDQTKVKLNLNGDPIRADDTRLQHPYANLWCYWVWYTEPLA